MDEFQILVKMGRNVGDSVVTEETAKGQKTGGADNFMPQGQGGQVGKWIFFHRCLRKNLILLS